MNIEHTFIAKIDVARMLGLKPRSSAFRTLEREGRLVPVRLTSKTLVFREADVLLLISSDRKKEPR